MRDPDREAAAQALHTAADLFMTTAALIELGEDQEAARQLRALRDALNAANLARDWEQFAQVLTAATAPLLAPGAEHGRTLFDAFVQHGGGEEDLGEHDRRARGLDLPDSWEEAVREMRREGAKTVEAWEEEGRGPKELN